jgi:hypothetical protein
MSEENKVTYIQTSEHAMVGGSAPLAPGERVLLDDENASHKHLKKLIEAQDPSVEHLSLLEVDPSAEKEAKEEYDEMLAKAEKIAAEARNEEARKADEQLEERQEVQEDQERHADSEVFPPQDEESIALAKKSGAGQRASTQADVAEEDKESSEEGDEGAQQQTPKQGRRRSSSKGGQE